METIILKTIILEALYNKNTNIEVLIYMLIKYNLFSHSKEKIKKNEIIEKFNINFQANIPEMIFQTIIPKLLSEQILSEEERTGKSKNIYIINKKILEKEYSEISNEINKEAEKIGKVVKFIKQALENYDNKITENKVEEYLINYYRENLKEPEIKGIISKFILDNSSNSEITEALLKLESGILIHTGLKKTNLTKSFEKEIILFLDTEILFNAVGYNGEIYENEFKILYDLVKEANSKKKYIKLCYFSDNREKIENIFKYVEMNLEITLDFSKKALLTIQNKCKEKSEVLFLKNDFFKKLSEMEIEEYVDEENYFDDIENHKYNLVPTSVIKEAYERKYRKYQGNELDIDAEDKKIADSYKTLTKMNILRNGNNNGKFEDQRYHFISCNGRTFTLALLEMKEEEEKSALVTTLSFCTKIMWFKLGKILETSSLKSLSTLNAILVLEKTINSSISEKYKEIKESAKSEQEMLEKLSILANALKYDYRNTKELEKVFEISQKSLEELCEMEEKEKNKAKEEISKQKEKNEQLEKENQLKDEVNTDLRKSDSRNKKKIRSLSREKIKNKKIEIFGYFYKKNKIEVVISLITLLGGIILGSGDVLFSEGKWWKVLLYESVVILYGLIFFFKNLKPKYNKEIIEYYKKIIKEDN